MHLLEIILIVVILAIDQISKYLIQLYLSPVGASLPLISGVFHLTNAHNTGAAWACFRAFAGCSSR
jgi:lipoprotein signal peptidase